MKNEHESREGRCRCGRVLFEITAPPLLTMACHCIGCQRMSSSAFSLSAAVPSQGFSVTKGEPVIGGIHGETRHYFCSYCMSWMFTRPAGMDSFVNIRSTMLDDVEWSEPFVETMTSEKLPWATTAAIHSYEKWPTMEDYERLTREYREWAEKRKTGTTTAG